MSWISSAGWWTSRWLWQGRPRAARCATGCWSPSASTREKLEESGEAETIWRAHAEYFLALAEEAEQVLIGPRETQWFDRLEEELDNIRETLTWSRARGQTELGLRLAGALREFWLWEGLHNEGRRWIESALIQEDRTSAVARAKALGAVSDLALGHSEIDRARESAEEGLQLSKESSIDGGHAQFFVWSNLLETRAPQLPEPEALATSARSSSLRRGGGPGGGLCLKACTPFSLARFIHWLTAPSVTPRASAICVCFQPRSFSSKARKRLPSRQSVAWLDNVFSIVEYSIPLSLHLYAEISSGSLLKYENGRVPMAAQQQGGAAMTKRLPVKPAPGPLEDYAHALRRPSSSCPRPARRFQALPGGALAPRRAQQDP